MTFWVVQVVYYHQQGFEFKGMVWDRFILFTLYTGVLWGMKAHIEWKSFLARLNVDGWYEVQKCILDRVPDAIAVIDIDHKVLYSNPQSKRICNDNIEVLSQSMHNIRRSSFSPNLKNYIDIVKTDAKSSKQFDYIT